MEAIVLSILGASSRPLGAYVIARKSRSLGVPLAPNQVYRILDRLRGRVQRVETLNAYVKRPGSTDAITLCRGCGRTSALDVKIGGEIDWVCSAAGFRAERLIAEVVGRCSRCRGMREPP